MKDYKFEDMFLTEEPKEQLEALNVRISEIGKTARKCLANGDFQQYKSMFEKEKDSVINAMVIYTANFGKNGYDNLNIYAFNMMRFVQQITDLRKLLTAVELDAKKGQELTGEQDGKN